MAKSIRSSTKKRNHAKLRSTVFGPVVDARTERLSAKLQELAAQPLKIETTKDAAEENTKTEAEAEDESDKMAIDESATTQSSSSKQRSNRVRKQPKRKPRNTMVFAKPHQVKLKDNHLLPNVNELYWALEFSAARCSALSHLGLFALAREGQSTAQTRIASQAIRSEDELESKDLLAQSPPAYSS
ncbi:hypothetical protein EYB25_008954 [Talaromyces marneffei]|uniref:DUF2423 domain-containing protein n=1 Tax=Talaromyces marneffei PM1 TaxID=1077442 RepID=A0A093UPU5_TALMA|nr:uncharacterized protein EYB26_009630 [Talaromyces marneffei]KAE8548573.1 hypothetical protein EYB25_008954 [Talaromyces marneffei]QGA21916.1 hypothetical protein EYB26_009630 [Talaromyces marneffei]